MVTTEQTHEEQLSEVLAGVVDDYLDECATLDDVDSDDLAQQLAAVVLERRMPPGVHYVPKDDYLDGRPRVVNFAGCAGCKTLEFCASAHRCTERAPLHSALPPEALRAAWGH